jgi:hypothetical protein
MALHSRRRREKPRGQALVEFAIIVPVMALLLLLAIDFGRVFFGWVALSNAARIAANEAAINPDAWVAPVNATDQARYRSQVLRDLQSINCAPPGGGVWALSDVPDPAFEDKVGTIDPHELGDHATVTLRCAFTFLTPLVGNLVGNPLLIGAHSEFAVRGGMIGSVPVSTAVPTPSATPVGPTPAPTPRPCVAPQIVGQRVNAGQTAWTTAGFSSANYVVTRPPSGNYVVTAQSLVGGQSYPCVTSITVSRP